MEFIFRWWLIIEILGWLALPFCMRVFRWLPDRGYTLSKAFGLLLASYFLWLGGSTGFLYNDLGGILMAILIVAGLSIWALSSKNDEKSPSLPSLLEFLRTHKRLIITSEVLFILAFAAWAGLRSYAPYKIMETGGEKFMEIAFLNGILSSKTFPPLDPWLSGFSISYYYFGYVMMALLTRLSGAPAGIGFDLSNALLFSLTALGSLGVAYNLIGLSAQRLQGKSPSEVWWDGKALVFGLLGALMTTLMANLEGVLESLRSSGMLPEGVLAWFDIPDLASAPVTNSWDPGISSGWWWWRGSRVLQDYNLLGQRQGISPITEFPFFSFLLGDNHPHVLGLPLVLVAISFALNLFEGQLRRKTEPQSTASWWNIPGFCLDGNWLVFLTGGVILGGLAFNNTWDFPIYLGLTLLAYTAASLAGKSDLKANDLLRPFILAVGWGLLSIGLYIFFYISFSSQAGGILPYIFPPTRLVQYFVMFGPFVFILLAFAGLYTWRHQLSWRIFFGWWLKVAAVGGGIILFITLTIVLIGSLGDKIPLLASAQSLLGGQDWNSVAAKMLLDRIKEPWLFLVLSALIALALHVIFGHLALIGPNTPTEDQPRENPNQTAILPGDIFVFLLIITAAALTWVTEFFYLRDSFALRMNTIFKFYYQAWVLFSAASAYALWWLSEQSFFKANVKPGLKVIRGFALAGAVGLIWLGMVYPTLSIYSRAEGFKAEPNLDGESSLERSNQDDWAAIRWLRDNVDKSGEVPTILEAPGKSYNYEGRISAFTGLPAVLGWSLHEGQWRGSYTEQSSREPDIQTIYTTNDGARALALIKKWNVRYVIVGSAERRYVMAVCQAGGCSLSGAMRKFDLILQPVFTQGQTTIYYVP